jgi:hypothetical protein
MESPNSVVKTSRSVIEKKLLTALEDGNTVAVLLSKQDLDDLIASLRDYELSDIGDWKDWRVYLKRCSDIADSLEQLHKEAFRTT